MRASLAKHDVFHAIADPTRREMLRLLSDKEMRVAAINERFPISRTAVSKHLRVLLEAGLVKERKVGRETRYSLQPESLFEVKRWISYYERFWENKVDLLKGFVESGETTPDQMRRQAKLLNSLIGTSPVNR